MALNSAAYLPCDSTTAHPDQHHLSIWYNATKNGSYLRAFFQIGRPCSVHTTYLPLLFL